MRVLFSPAEAKYVKCQRVKLWDKSRFKIPSDLKLSVRRPKLGLMTSAQILNRSEITSEDLVPDFIATVLFFFFLPSN